MKKLNEKKIIQLMNKKKIRSEDIEIFKLGNGKCAVCVDTLVESTDIPKCSELSDISRKSVVSSLSDFAAKGVIPKFLYRIINVTKKQYQKNKYKNYPKVFQVYVKNSKFNY